MFANVRNYVCVCVYQFRLARAALLYLESHHVNFFRYVGQSRKRKTNRYLTRCMFRINNPSRWIGVISVSGEKRRRRRRGRRGIRRRRSDAKKRGKKERNDGGDERDVRSSLPIASLVASLEAAQGDPHSPHPSLPKRYPALSNNVGTRPWYFISHRVRVNDALRCVRDSFRGRDGAYTMYIRHANLQTLCRIRTERCYLGGRNPSSRICVKRKSRAIGVFILPGGREGEGRQKTDDDFVF